MSSGRIRFGVVGCGYWGPNLVHVVSENPAAELVVCCDSAGEKLRRIEGRYPAVRTTSSFAKMLEEDLDAVIVATPIETHFELASQAFLSGKHVLVEKPMTYSSSEAMELIQTAEKYKRVLMVGHTFEYSPPVVAVRKLIERGELGRILYVSSSRLNLGIYRKTVDVIWDLAPHDFSILYFWLGEVATRARAIGRACVRDGLLDIAFIDLEFASGIIGRIEVSWIAPTKLRRTTLVGTNRMVLYDDVETNEKIKIYERSVQCVQPQSFGEWQLTYRLGDVSSPYLESQEPLAIELDHFIQCIRQGLRPQSDGWSGYHVVKTVEAAQRSLQEDGTYQPVFEGASCTSKPGLE